MLYNRKYTGNYEIRVECVKTQKRFTKSYLNIQAYEKQILHQY